MIEQAKARQEACCNASETEYFGARSQIDTLMQRHSFCAGFYRGYAAAIAAAPAQPSAVESNTAYAELPSHAFNIDPGSGGNIKGYSADQMRVFADATETLRTRRQTQAPAYNIVALSPLPSPDHSERIYGGHGNEIVHSYYTDHQMREYARQEVHRAEAAWQARASRGQAPVQPQHIEAMERAWLWMENQADGQSKGGHETFDLMMLREERDALRTAIDATPTPQADSQPAPLSRQQICDKFSFLEGMVNEWGFDSIVSRAEESQARAIAARVTADSVLEDAVDGDVDAVALTRYKVVPAHESMFHRFAVVAGDGNQQLFVGREAECENMARKFAGAFLDGAFYQSNIAPTPQADSVLEDAARLERERICAAIKAEDDYCVEHGDYMLDSDDCIKIVRGEWVRPDYLVDAARKQGANHD